MPFPLPSDLRFQCRPVDPGASAPFRLPSDPRASVPVPTAVWTCFSGCCYITPRGAAKPADGRPRVGLLCCGFGPIRPIPEALVPFPIAVWLPLYTSTLQLHGPLPNAPGSSDLPIEASA